MRLLSRILNAWSEPDLWSVPDRLLSFGPQVGEKEPIGNSFIDYAEEIYKKSGPVFTCLFIRQFLFSEVRFQWRRIEDGRPGPLFGTPELSLLENPWEHGTTGELLGRMEQNNSLAGNFYAARVEDEHGKRLRVLRPDWVKIVTGSPSDDPFDYRARVVGYVYQSEPRRGKSDPVTFLPEQIVHWSPLPDPSAQWRGMSWLTPLLPEIDSDDSATKHKREIFRHGGQPWAITYDSTITGEEFKLYVAAFKAEHSGVDKAYKTLHLGGGADLKAIGANFQELDFKALQGTSETRIAAASGLGAVMAQFSEGLAGSSLNTGNFTAARKRSETMLFRPLWRMAAASLQSVLVAPAGAHLWYDPRDIAFLRDDAAEEAKIRHQDASTLETLWRTGFTPDSSIMAVTTGDYTQLQHTGVESIQTQRVPGEPDPTYPADLTVNERRALDGLEPVPGGDAIYMPASDIPAIDLET